MRKLALIISDFAFLPNLYDIQIMKRYVMIIFRDLSPCKEVYLANSLGVKQAMRRYSSRKITIYELF